MKKNLVLSVVSESTLFEYLLANVSGMSRNNLKSALKRGQILVDGKSRKDYALALKPGQKVEVVMGNVKAVSLPFPIMYEDSEILVINKPAGLLAIGSDKDNINTAYHAVTDYVKSSGGKGDRVFVVHRLDRDTSGLMLFAKNDKLKFAFQDNWEELCIFRGYTALVEGQMEDSEGTVSSWLRQTKTLLMYSSQTQGDGKFAVTKYRVLRCSPETSLLDIEIKTGRKNQIRVHMSDLGHPIVGDKKYGAKTNPLGRLGLHASKLTIKHPFNDRVLEFVSDSKFK